MQLGNRTNLEEVRQRGAFSNRRAADRLAVTVLPIVQQIEASGVRAYTGIARVLNTLGIRTGRDWYPATVRNLCARTKAGAMHPALPVNRERKATTGSQALEQRHTLFTML